MTSILGAIMKYTLFALAILVASQIEINHKRICDHVGGITGSLGIQKNLRSISERFDFTQGNDVAYSKNKKGQGSSRQSHEEPKPNLEHNPADRAALSGVIKRSR
jgi:hypothetical protein